MAHPKATGSTWLWKYDGKLWPVVLCEDSRPPKEFMNSRSTELAVPAILLGKHKYIWITRKGLQEVDPSKDYSNGLWQCKGTHWEARSDADRDEGLRCTAFKLDMVHWEDDRWWSNYISNELEAQKLSRAIHRRKSKRTSSDDGENVDDRRKRSSITNGNLPTPDTTQNSRSDSSVEVQQSSGQGEQDPLQVVREAHRQEVIDKKLIYTEATIFVGEDHTPFYLTRDQLSQCDSLRDMLRFEKGLTNHVNLYDEIDITVEEFYPVWEFLTTRDFKPRHVGGDISLLEDVFLEEDKDAAMKIIATVCMTAGKLAFSALQRLCLKKLKALCPLSVHGLVLIVKYCEILDDDANGRVRAWLVEHTAEHFLSLLGQNHVAMLRLINEHEEFREDVIERLPLHKDTRMRGMG